MRLVKFQISVGSVPVNLLLDKDREKRFVKRPKSVGSLPVNRLGPNDKNVKLDKSPSSVGKFPIRSFPFWIWWSPCPKFKCPVIIKCVQNMKSQWYAGFFCHHYYPLMFFNLRSFVIWGQFELIFPDNKTLSPKTNAAGTEQNIKNSSCNFSHWSMLNTVYHIAMIHWS